MAVARIEPVPGSCPLPSGRQDENPEPEFAENNGIHGDIPLVHSDRRHNQRGGCGFRWLARNVGINQILHLPPASKRIGGRRLDRDEKSPELGGKG